MIHEGFIGEPTTSSRIAPCEEVVGF